ncbi:Chemosensory pili system protein ChpA (Sensor histidine kinase/response regulator) [Burkholderiales bacterium 8X]|nr:Chemosensory pili system protein ChpA (Sensor histidine kinase/response regulator) [Burkholderiales bacterium 8X]
MSTPSPASAPTTALSPAAEDLGPLAWVLAEVQKSLDNASKTLRRFIREGGTGAEQDAAPLRLARQQLHQAVGALQMVGHPAPGLVLGAVEFALQTFVSEPTRCNEAAVKTIERAGFAVSDFLNAVIGGKQVSAVALFPQYRDVLELVGNERVHPADLWGGPWRWAEIRPAASQSALVYDPAVRSKLDREVLSVVRSGDDQAAKRLHRLCLGLGRGSAVPRVASFWTLAAGFFEALALALIPPDSYAKRAASRVLLQYATLARGDTTVSDRLGQDLLFFCAQAVPGPGDDAATLRAVRTAWNITTEQSVDYTVEQFGRFDPVVLAQARKRIETAKEMWSSLSGGDVSRVRQVADALSQLGESIQKLHPASSPLVQALNNAVDSSVRSGRAPSTELAMEVATSVLYLEAAFEDLDPHDRQLTARTIQLAGRIDRVREGGRSEPLESWMEELYRRVSDRQTMGTVVDELRSHLGELEKSLDQFFRRPAEKPLLRDVPSQLLQMRGVFSVLGLDQATQAVQRMRETVDQLLAADSARQSADDFELLGNNLGALGFLIDMLGYQPALAKRLFVFDEEAGELKPLMGRQAAEAAAAPQVLQDAPPPSFAVTEGPVQVASTVLSVEEVDAQIAAKLAALAGPNRKAPSPIEEFSQAAASWTAKITGPAPLEPLPHTEVTELEEDDLQNIFLDEAREVLHNGLAAVSVLGGTPDDHGELTVLRRAFHTLKGSARMVGLMDYGDAAWSFEQVLNSWLADQRPATPELLSTTRKALTDFASWVEAIAAGEPHGWQSAPFKAAAENLSRDEPKVVSTRVADVDALVAAARHIASAEAAEDHPAVAADAGMPPVPLSLPELPDLDLNLEFDTDLAALESASNERQRDRDRDHELEPDTGLDSDFASTDFLEFEAPADPAGTASELSLPDRFEEIDFLKSLNAAVQETSGRDDAAEMAPPVESLSQDDLLQRAAPGARLEPSAPNAAEAERSAEFDEFDEFVAELAAEVAAPAPATEGEPSPPRDPVDGTDEEAPAFATEAAKASENDHAGEVVSADAADRRADAVAADVPPPAVEEAEAVMAAAASEFSSIDDPVAAEQPSAAEEPVKVIGPLRIGLPLYNVYLVEADEWSRQLVDEVGEWALEPHMRIGDTTINLAHSLAGSSATVGFHGLSGMARLMEAALQHLQMHGRGTATQGAVLSAAAEEIRRLLHQFAAGFLKEPAEGTLHALRAVASAPIADDGMAAAATPSAEPSRRTMVDATVDDADDAIDAVDGIDADLFPIFEEEAAELLPVLGTALRQWAERPEDPAPRASTLRTLHTLKGSARLAGAMRLGERAHLMESEIEVLGSAGVDRASIEQLLARFDGLQASFDALRAANEPASTETASAAAVGAEAEAKPSGVAPPTQVASEAEAASASASASGVASEPASAPSTEPSGLTSSEAVAEAKADTTVPRRPMVLPSPSALTPLRPRTNQQVRVSSHLLDRLMTQAGEVIITRSRLEAQLVHLRSSLSDLTGNLDRLRQQLRDVEVQAESQMQSRLAQAKDSQQGFDPLEFDRFTRVQELTRMMAESVNDVATVQRTLQKTVQTTEDDLSAQARQTRELQRGLLRTRMVEFEGISERLYRVVRQAAKDAGKQVRLDIVGGTIEMDRGVLDRMMPAFEHLLRNCVAHGIEPAPQREAAGKDAVGLIVIELHHEGNDVSVTFRDDGAGLNHARVAERAIALGLMAPGQPLGADELAQFIFQPGFSTADEVSELAGRGIGMDVVRAQVAGLGGRIETQTEQGAGTSFKLVLPLTTAVTHVVMLRTGGTSVGVPSNVVEIVQRIGASDTESAYQRQHFSFGGEDIPFYSGSALLQGAQRGHHVIGKANTVVIVRSAAQRVALHVDEVLGNQEVVVKNLGPQLSRLPGMAGISVLASGEVALIFNPVALAAVHGDKARALQVPSAAASGQAPADAAPGTAVEPPMMPLVLVVDDSITVRRVTQRLLQREGFRVTLAADGLQALERLQQERPAVVLSDIEMPRMDGFDLARNIRADASLASLPIIMITSRIAEKHRDHARVLGVNHYLGKPYSEDELLRLVRSYTNAPTAETPRRGGGSLAAQLTEAAA